MFQRLTVAALVATVLAGVSAATSSALSASGSCDGLLSLTLPDTTITAAKPVSAGPFEAPGASPTAPPVQVPAFCRVTATIRPSADSHINIEVWLPPASEWNGQFLGTGNGGAGGVIFYRALVSGLHQKFAVTNTDMGTTTTGLDFSFGIGHPELQKDWAYRATHLMTVVAKQIVESYYGRVPRLAYFSGCSTGGHQAITEARRYPDDYDGIVAGDPANNRIRLHTVTTWNWLATHEDPDAYIPPAKIPTIHTAVVQACDALDGIKDGVIDDPRKCSFDPSALLCRGGDAADCLTAKQVTALKKIYQGPKNPRTGEQIFPGMYPGSEANPSGLERTLATPPGSKMPVNTLLAWATSWKGPQFDFDKDLEAVRRELTFIDDADPNLHAFRARGGKLMLYSGRADPLIPAADTVSFYEGMQRAMGGPSETAKFSRLFMLPGMGHCAAGDGPNNFDPLVALTSWVENGTPPDRFIASRIINGKVERTRPICAYPKYAKWNGVGSTDDAANFTCVER